MNAVGLLAPLTYRIGAKAKHAGCAAFFPNWVSTNVKARAINVAVGGSNPGGQPIAERLVGTLRRESFDRLLIVNPRHLERVMGEYLDHYSHAPR